MSQDEVTITIQPWGKTGKFRRWTSLLNAASSLKAYVVSVCGGKGLCGKCKVRVISGQENLNKLTKSELRYLTPEEISKGYRLACQAFATGDITIYVPQRSRITVQRLQVEGIEVPVEVNPHVRKVYLEIPPPTLETVHADDEQIRSQLEEKIGADVETSYDVLKILPEVLRAAKWRVTAVLWKDRVIAVEKGDTRDRMYGFACDVGSTKLAGYLVDLNTGRVMATTSAMNPQIRFGDDIISRISYVITRGESGLKELQETVVASINEMIETACKKASVDPSEIYELTFAGNTAMELFLLGIWPKYVAYSPYQPPRKAGVTINAREIGLRANTNAIAYVMPVIGGFVGGDQVAVILATDLLNRDEISLELDVGTNTEISLGNRELLMTVSTPSGPAFEGMSIKYGMRAAEGAIERVSIDPSSLEPEYMVIGDTKPVGICGSGLIDVLAEMLKAGIIDWTGTFNRELSKDSKRVRRGPDGWEYVLVNKAESGVGEDIVITQKDIRELQKAKAAVRSGTEVLMARMGIKEEEIENFFVAGAFGNYIDPENARIIGLYPELPIDKYKFVGNAAGTGAKLVLISREMREKAEEIPKRVKYLELAADPDFQRAFLDSMYLPFRDLDRYPLTVEYLKRFNYLFKR